MLDTSQRKQQIENENEFVPTLQLWGCPPVKMLSYWVWLIGVSTPNELNVMSCIMFPTLAGLRALFLQLTTRTHDGRTRQILLKNNFTVWIWLCFGYARHWLHYFRIIGQLNPPLTMVEKCSKLSKPWLLTNDTGCCWWLTQCQRYYMAPPLRAVGPPSLLYFCGHW